MSALTTVAVVALFAVWLVVAAAICIRGWRAIRAGRAVEPDWETGEDR